MTMRASRLRPWACAALLPLATGCTTLTPPDGQAKATSPSAEWEGPATLNAPGLKWPDGSNFTRSTHVSYPKPRLNTVEFEQAMRTRAEVVEEQEEVLTKAV